MAIWPSDPGDSAAVTQLDPLVLLKVTIPTFDFGSRELKKVTFSQNCQDWIFDIFVFSSNDEFSMEITEKKKRTLGKMGQKKKGRMKASIKHVGAAAPAGSKLGSNRNNTR